MNLIKRIINNQLSSLRQSIRDWQDPNREDNQTMCDEFTIDNIPMGLYSSFITQATAAGVKFNGNIAMIDDIVLNVVYDKDAEVIHITPTHRPFYVGCDTIKSHLQSIADKSKLAFTRQGSL